jgi:hypothetical protein
MIARWGMQMLAAGLLAAGIASALTSPAFADEAFGVESFASSVVSDVGGVPATQAGSHPYALTTSIVFNHVVTAIEAGQPQRVRTNGDPKDIELNLPAGVIVDPRATGTRCTESELESPVGPASCPNGAAVGVFSIYLDGIEVLDEPVYDMAPPAGVPVELGFNAAGIGLIMHVGGRLRTGSDYGLSADISEISDEHPIYGLEITLWGDPSDASHDEERGLCAGQKAKQSFKKTGIHESCPVERTAEPFLTMPSSCTNEPLTTTVSTDSWQEPGAYLEPSGTNIEPPDTLGEHLTSSSLPLTGCTSLDFDPELTVSTAEPQAASAESPSGLNIDLKLPLQESADDVAGAEPKEAAVTLPAGFAISPSAAEGREACTPAEIELGDAKAPACPDASILGAAKIVTPLLEDPLEGSLYLAQPYANDSAFGSPEHPGGSLLAVYLVAEADGVLIKLAGNVQANPQTGQLTIAFANLPQLPIGEIELSLYGGERALLATPAACGSYTVQSTLTPWSGTPAVTQASNLKIGSGPGGGACPTAGFAPSFTAGTVENQAGTSSAFTLTLSRRAGEQRFGAFTAKLPAGLSGILGGVAPCPEPAASQGDCPPAAELGTATVGAGPGSDPFYLPAPGQPPNRIYLTGPYAGAPFGLSIVVPALVGPFDLGTIVVRASVAIDPRTAQLTISSGPGVDGGVDGIPIIKDGIPLDIRTLELNIDRPGLILNPTGCARQSIAGRIVSAAGVSAAVSSPFQAVNCAREPFRARLLALTHARTSKAGGAYLHVKVVSGPGQANIAKVEVDLPKQLPLRLTTLQRACRAKVFEAGPAACAAASIVGTATVVTPMLPGTLSGPAYLVSHGTTAFPALVLVLQGDGVKIDLEGQTNIARGITSIAFRSLPDTPIGTFDLVLPTGPHSAFATNLPTKTKGGLCAQTLRMPTAIVGQNGAQLKQATTIGITGCLPTRAKPKRAKRGKRAGRPERKVGRR